MTPELFVSEILTQVSRKVRKILDGTYQDFSACKDTLSPIESIQPEELFVKRKEFEYQQEVRILVNTDDTEILSRLERPIEIGEIHDIASLIEGYLSEGIEIEAKFDVIAVD